MSDVPGLFCLQARFCPTAKPYSSDPNAKPVDLIPEENWTEAMKNLAS